MKKFLRKIFRSRDIETEASIRDEQQSAFHPDRPIQSIEEDRLGFSPIADNLATSILRMNAKDGFVIGIEGAWGCGKSSILNLFCKKIETNPNIAIVRFSPWIIGSRDGMVTSLIGELSALIEKKTGKKDIVRKLRKYGASVGKLASLASLASILGVPYADKVVGLLDKGKEALSQSKPLDQLKGEIADALRKLNTVFLIIIDDIDRLEPEEALEVMRLIRAVGDFPNVIYTLCYDRKILSECLKTALRIENGDAFLQKIVQASFSVPKPEEFDLRSWLNEECHLLHQAIAGTSLSKDTSERLKSVCFTQGGQISTPREVILTLNSLRLTYPPIVGKVDFPDLCWLHIAKIKNDSFYRWIENYLNVFSIVARGEGSIDEQEQTQIAEELLRHLGLTRDTAHRTGAIRAFVNLQEHLPGIGSYLPEGGNSKGIVFNNLQDNEHGDLERGLRLGSPSHYRLYFSFSQPDGVLDETELAAIISKANSGVSVEDGFRNFIGISRTQGGTMYAVLLDRLKRTALERYTGDGIKALLNALVETIDDARRRESEADRHFKISLGRSATLFLEYVLPMMDSSERTEFISSLFKEGKSIGWLMSDFIGRELFAYGRNGLRAEGQPILTVEELDSAVDIINERLTGNERSSIPTVPEPLSFFYRWQQSGDAGRENLKNWIAQFSRDDEGFLELLAMCRSYAVSSSVGAYRPLNKRDIDNLLGDAEAAIHRIDGIIQNSQSDLLKRKAQELKNSYSAEKF